MRKEFESCSGNLETQDDSIVFTRTFEHELCPKGHEMYATKWGKDWIFICLQCLVADKKEPVQARTYPINCDLCGKPIESWETNPHLACAQKEAYLDSNLRELLDNGMAKSSKFWCRRGYTICGYWYRDGCHKSGQCKDKKRKESSK